MSYVVDDAKKFHVLAPFEEHNKIKMWCHNAFGQEGWYQGLWGWSNTEYISSGPLANNYCVTYEFTLEEYAVLFALRWGR